MSIRVQGDLGVAFERLLKLVLYFCSDHTVHLYTDWNLAIDDNNNNLFFFSNFIYNISLSITSANLAKKAICTWLAYNKK